MSFKFEDKFFNEFILIKQFKINNLITNNKSKANDNYNTNGFQISKFFEYKLSKD